MLLGTLLVHLGAPPPTAGGEDDLPEEVAEGDEAAAPGVRASPAAEALLDELVRTSRLPRKVAERIRLALHAQSIFFEPRPKARRRRRGRGLAGQPYFTDALQLLRITVEATGTGVDVYHRWAAEAATPAAAARREPRRAGDHGRGGGGARPARRARAPGRATGGARATPRRPARSGSSRSSWAGTAPATDEAVPAGGEGAITTVEAGPAGSAPGRRGGRPVEAPPARRTPPPPPRGGWRGWRAARAAPRRVAHRPRPRSSRIPPKLAALTDPSP